MKFKTIAASTTAALALTGCAPDVQTSVSTIHEGVFEDYNERYGCAFDNVDLEFVEDIPEVRPGETTLAYAEAGRIVIDLTEISESSDKQTRDLLAHELGHACVTESVLELQPNMVLADGTLVRSIDGFAMNVTTPDGLETGFRLFEEGAADALAHNLYPGYQVNHGGYIGLRNLTNNLLAEHGITHEQLAEQLQNNGLLEFLISLGEFPDITTAEVEGWMSEYQVAFLEN